ncbi:M1 family metallopeptidase [Haliangium sp. UPWRP_2]|uniref:M1 family metallopeptidase n=1 Tax=Haliangium sp. UPWRP_2 TaxID=1931276 RepID=UPI000B548DDF|nr:M1 family metallopeptidase [Haliangium sp. UPWRP_2]PSM31983.1 M1 family peptidase [Haliangium sp. UPWRP_2]
MSKRAFRLPSSVRPTQYDITLSTDPGRSDFAGTVRITAEVSQTVASVVLHSRELTLHSATLHAGGTTQPLGITLQPEQETATLTATGPITPGRIDIDIAFAGKLAPSMHGIYLATDGVHRAICTQCEATDARAIFPCFDEPEFKAVLKWTLHTTPGLTALTNGPQREHSDGVSATGIAEQIVAFEPTKPVSSYLAAVAIGDFESSPESRVGDVPLRVYAPRGKANQTGFAQDLATRLLPWYEHYFDFAYPFAKYDQVAVPGFDAGAMENIGLVLFRQNLLLMDPKSASWRQEKIIARVVAHEMAHMWFGNLVTMCWWDDLWLNEAFAEWMAHKAVHATVPSYRIWDDSAEDKSRALFDDALQSTHPIYTAVATPEEALEMFDSITYQKGCAVMRMLENFLGEEHFRTGLRAYMKQYQWRNAAGADLWRALEAASGRPVGTLMKSWVEQPGFPLLSVDFAEASGDAVLHFRQSRFFSDPKAAATSQVWNVPVVIRYQDDRGVQEHRFILDRSEHQERLPSSGAVRWFYANADDVGFYRLQFGELALAALLHEGLRQLGPIEQVGLLEDQWALVRAGRSGIMPFIDVLRALAGVREHNVLRALIDRLDMLDLLAKDAGDREARLKLRSLIGSLLSSQLQELGFAPRPEESQNDIQRRALLIGALGNLARSEDVIAQSKHYASIERSDPHAVDPNLAGVFVAVAAKFGDEDDFERWVATFLDRKQAGRTPQEVSRYLHTLSVFRRPGLPERTLELLEEGSIPQEALAQVLGQLLAYRHSQESAWRFLRNRWSLLRERVGDMGLSRLVEAVGRLPAAHREDIVRFFERNTPNGAERALARALERMDQHEELRQRVTPDLLTYLRRHEPETE